MKSKEIILAICIALIAILVAGSTYAPTRNFEIKDEEPIQILFVGDIMLDRVVRTTIDKNGFASVFEEVKNIFENIDMAVGNLEGTITANPSVSVKDHGNLHFTFDPSVALELKDLGFTGFSLANNHALDFGTEGFLTTQVNLSSAGLFSFGSPSNDITVSKQVEVKGQNICFVGYHALYKEDTQPVVLEITRLKPNCNFVVVFAHWGVEYSTTESTDQKREAHRFVDAGADLVIGAHPHVIEPIEIYKDKAIFYSLGNFIFDQDFSLATRQGLAVRLELGPSTETFHLIGIEMLRSKLYFPEKEAFQIRTNILTSELPVDLAKSVDVDGVFTLTR
ncbi:CapA family protein [Candidatus Parcubacteria bacterium]|nr:CapA family protein [Candidatus Parcubacteria bacterium]